ncbi:MAG: hypothetical protein HYZ51_00270 [Candidatus Doudnabacteria bacterium]|nr:hypothetical protein [Candidatus Doudnabacteria bacterium]
MNTICFGQQPCGFFPKRFLVAKINTARKLQKELGGKIIFFYHDSDADYRETITILKDKTTGAEVRLNFTQENKLQKKHSPLYLKRIPKGWTAEILKQLPRFVDQQLMDIFSSVDATNISDYCLQMYKKLGLLDAIDIIKSSNDAFRNQACKIQAGFADVEYQGEIVRAKIEADRLALHEGGGVYTYLPKPDKLSKEQISPGAGERFSWMQSVIHCTHYIYGEGEKDYLKFDEFPRVQFIQRDTIENPEYAYIPNF